MVTIGTFTLLIVSFLSISLILTVVYFSLYAELEEKLEKKYSLLMTKQNISATEIHAKVDEAIAEIVLKMEMNYAFVTTKQNISATEIHTLANEAREKMQKRETVAFSAYRSSPQTMSYNDILKFNGIWANEGNGYEPKSGVFRAPNPGLYHFTAVVMSTDGKSLSLYLCYNGVRKTRRYLSGDGYKTGTFDVLLNLQKADTVYINSDASQTIFGSSDKYVTFSGYRIT